VCIVCVSVYCLRQCVLFASVWNVWFFRHCFFSFLTLGLSRSTPRDLDEYDVNNLFFGILLALLNSTMFALFFAFLLGRIVPSHAPPQMGVEPLPESARGDVHEDVDEEQDLMTRMRRGSVFDMDV